LLGGALFGGLGEQGELVGQVAGQLIDLGDSSRELTRPKCSWPRYPTRVMFRPWPSVPTDTG
jgi:hypothetical protein